MQYKERMIVSLNRLIKHLCPASDGDEAFHENQNRLFVLIGLITFGFSLLYGVVSLSIGFLAGVMVQLVCALGMLSVLKLFQRTGRYRLCTHLLLANSVFISILGCSFLSGGIHSMVTPWFVLAPIASVLFQHRGRDTLAWVVLTCALITAYGLADLFGYDFPELYDARYKSVFNALCLTGLALILSWFAFVFGQNRKEAMAQSDRQKAALEQALVEIEHLAFYDPLTQLPNRRLLMDRLAQACLTSCRQSSYAALMFIDLDAFKSLNDRYGHEAGDLLLIQVARRLVGCLRETDTVARYGGDEFAVILNALDRDLDLSRDDVCGIAAKLRASLAEPYVLDLTLENQHTVTIEHLCTASIGVVIFIEAAEAQKRLLVHADKAMYAAKLAGGDAVFLHAEHAPVPLVTGLPKSR